MCSQRKITTIGVVPLGRLPSQARDKALHPKKAKEGLAMRIIADFHGEAAARDAREAFARVFKDREAPADVPEFRRPAGDGKVFLARLLAECGLAKSNSEGMRLIAQRGVHLDGAPVDPGTREIDVSPGREILLKVGKRHFARVRFD